MHAVNRLLSIVGLRLSNATGSANGSNDVWPEEFVQKYERDLDELKQHSMGFEVFRGPRYDVGSHPVSHRDFECSFAAQHIAAQNPTAMLDIGSYREFILGLLANYKITTLDVREREPASANEIVLTGDAKQLDIAADSFDAIVS